MPTTKKPNNYAFIDSQNLHLGVKSQGWEIDYARFRQYLRDKFDVQKAYLFIGYLPQNADLYRDLQSYGYILIFKETLKIKNRLIKGNVDAELVLEAMIRYELYDYAVIISGDGDFACLIKYLYTNNKLYMVMVPNKSYSTLIKKTAKEKIMLITDLKDKIKK